MPNSKDGGAILKVLLKLYIYVGGSKRPPFFSPPPHLLMHVNNIVQNSNSDLY